MGLVFLVLTLVVEINGTCRCGIWVRREGMVLSEVVVGSEVFARKGVFGEEERTRKSRREVQFGCFSVYLSESVVLRRTAK